MSENINLTIKKVENISRHINNVIQFANLLGRRLIEKGDTYSDLGRKLIANSYLHDHSKFNGIEWLHLVAYDKNNVDLAMAIKNHVLTNKHHPEYWGGIEHMPKIYLLEAICDWAARSSEIGNDLRDWVKNKATKRYNFKVQSNIYKEIKLYIDILLDPELT